MRDRILDLARAGVPDDKIAAVLTGEGHRSPNCAEKVVPITVQRIRLSAGIKVTSTLDQGHILRLSREPNKAVLTKGTRMRRRWRQCRFIPGRKPTASAAISTSARVSYSIPFCGFFFDLLNEWIRWRGMPPKTLQLPLQFLFPANERIR